MAILQMNFLSMKLGMQTNVSVFLPSFAPSPEAAGKTDAELYPAGRKYPALWLLADETGDDSQWLRLSAIADLAQKYGFAVVMPCPYEKLYSEEDPGQKFTSYITEELWTICTGMFPICTDRECSCIIGAGLGAYGALKCALTAPERFSKAVMIGGAYEDGLKEGYLQDLKAEMAANGLIPPLALDDAPADDAELRVKAAALKAEGRQLPDVLVCWAKGSPLAAYARRAAKNLEADGFDIALLTKDEEDSWSFRSEALKQALDWISAEEHHHEEGCHGCCAL